jgi:hypothetical protein
MSIPGPSLVEVALIRGVQTVEKLKAVLPKSWKFARRKDKDHEIAICVPTHQLYASKEDLEVLYKALSDADCQWWNEKEEADRRLPKKRH